MRFSTLSMLALCVGCTPEAEPDKGGNGKGGSNTAQEPSSDPTGATSTTPGTPTGTPVDTTEVSGTGYSIDFTTATWLEPAGAGDLLAGLFGAGGLFLGIMDIRDTEIDIIAGIVEEGHQDPCQPTSDVETAPFENPGFLLELDELALVVEDFEIVITDLHVAGRILEDGQTLDEVSLAGITDTRGLDEALGMGAGAICDLVGLLGATCITCEDGEDACLAIDMRDAIADAMDSEIEPLTEADIAARTDCG